MKDIPVQYVYVENKIFTSFYSRFFKQVTPGFGDGISFLFTPAGFQKREKKVWYFAAAPGAGKTPGRPWQNRKTRHFGRGKTVRSAAGLPEEGGGKEKEANFTIFRAGL